MSYERTADIWQYQNIRNTVCMHRSLKIPTSEIQINEILLHLLSVILHRKFSMEQGVLSAKSKTSLAHVKKVKQSHYRPEQAHRVPGS